MTNEEEQMIDDILNNCTDEDLSNDIDETRILSDDDLKQIEESED